jgi:hypothetical protein
VDDNEAKWYERGSRKLLSRVGCRIDLFLITKDLCGFCNDFEILHDVCISDHFPVQMALLGGDLEHGSGFWKLNLSHLDPEDYCELIENVLLSVDTSLSICDWWENAKNRVKK